jgi:hypothetical protein
MAELTETACGANAANRHGILVFTAEGAIFIELELDPIT